MNEAEKELYENPTIQEFFNQYKKNTLLSEIILCIVMWPLGILALLITFIIFVTINSLLNCLIAIDEWLNSL